MKETYMKRSTSPTGRRKQTEARHKILDAASAGRGSVTTPRFYMRNINEAVFMCRQRQLVTGKVLAAAGFNATRR